MSLFCLNHSFFYLLYFCPSRDRSKINKHGCGLARKRHENGEYDRNFITFYDFTQALKGQNYRSFRADVSHI